MFWLALIGLGLAAAGGVLGMVGQAQANQQQIREDELKAQQLLASQGVYQAQEAAIRADTADIQADRAAAARMRDISMQELAIQGAQISRQGAAAVGSVAAQAGVGNIGGESVLRRAAGIRRQVGEQMTLLQGRGERVGLEYADITRGLTTRERGAEAQMAGAEYNIQLAGQNAQLIREEADWLKQYGWMSVLGVGLSSFGGIAQTAAGINWGGLSGNPFTVGRG